MKEIDSFTDVKTIDNRNIPGIIITFIFMLLCILPFLPFDELKIFYTIYYLAPVAFITALLAFKNIRILTDYIYAKNIKFSDLLDKQHTDIEKKTKFLKYHKISLYIASSLLIMGYVCYLTLEYPNGNINIFIVIGALRGWGSIYFDMQHKFSEFCKEYLYERKESESKQTELTSL